MKRHLLLLILFVSSLLGYGQTILITQSPATLRACDTVNFTVTVNGISANNNIRVRIKNSAFTTFLSANVPSALVNGYIQIDTVVNSNSFTFNYSNKLICNAARLNVDSVSNDTFLDSIIVNKNSENNVILTKSYTAANPYYQYLNGSYYEVSGDVNEEIIGNLRLKNFNAPYSGFFEVVEQMPVGTSIVSINVHGEQIISHTHDANTNTYTTIIKVNSNDTLIYQPTYTINSCTYQTNTRLVSVRMGCSATDICKTILNNQPSPYNYVRKAAVLSITAIEEELSDATCSIEKSWKRTYIFKNTGNREATNINVRPYRNISGNGIPIYSFALIQEGSVHFRLSDTDSSHIIKEEHPVTTTNVCGEGTSIASTKTNREGFTDTLGTYAIVDRLGVGDSIILTYIAYRCCENNVGPFSFEDDLLPTYNYVATSNYNSANLGAIAFFKAHPCNSGNTEYSASAYAIPYSENVSISQYAICSTTHILGDLRNGSSEGESFKAKVENLTYSNSLFATTDTSYQIWIKIDSELGLYNKDSIYFQTQDRNKIWSPYYVSDTMNTGIGTELKHERWAYFRLNDLPAATTIQTFFNNSSTINFTMQSYCNAKSPKSAYSITTYIKETDCDSCLMPIISGSCAVAVQCPGCFLPGTLVRKTTVERKTFGYLDVYNDRIPDNYPVKVDPDNPQILKDRIMFGDTLEISMNLVVWDIPSLDSNSMSLQNLAANNKFLNRAYGILTIPAGGGMSVIDTKIHYSRSNGTATINGADTTGGLSVVMAKKSTSYFHPRGRTDSVQLGNMTISYDVSLPTMNSLGIPINSQTHFLENDTITITSRLVFNKHLGTVFLEPELVSQAYITGAIPTNRFEKPTDYFTVSLPSTPDSIDISKSFWCEDFGGYMSLVDYTLMPIPYTSYGDANYLGNCGRNATLNYSAQFPVFLADYFPYEYRNVLAIDSAKLTPPPGYEVVSTAQAWTELIYSNPPFCQVERRIDLPVNNNKINTSILNTRAITNCAGRNDIFLTDERCNYYVSFQYRPICNNNVALIDSTLLKLEVWFNSPQSSGYFPYLSTSPTRKFAPTLTANSTQNQAATSSFALQPIQIRNTQQYFDDPRGEYYKNTPNAFVVFKNKNSRIQIQSINNNPITNDQILQLGHIGSISNPYSIVSQINLNVNASYNCIELPSNKFDVKDSILMYYGWSCNGYIDSIQQINNPINCLKLDSVWHYVTPLPLTKEIALNTGKDTLENCDTTSMRILLRSKSQGNLYDLVGSVIVEVPASVQPCSTTATIRYKDSTNTTTTANIGVTLDNSIADSNRYIYDLTPFTQSGLSNGDSILILGCLQTTCTYQDVAKILLETRSIAYCGDTINQKDSTLIFIKPYTPAVPDTLTITCEPITLQQGGTFSTNITIGNHSSTPSNGNTLHLTLPSGVTAQGWDDNNNTFSLPLGAIEPGNTIIPVTLVNNTDCGTFNYQINLSQLDTVFCSSDTCQRIYTAAACSSTVTVNCTLDTITITTTTQIACVGNEIILQATTNEINPTIQWYANGVSIGTGLSITYTPITAGITTFIASSSGSTSDSIKIDIQPSACCRDYFVNAKSTVSSPFLGADGVITVFSGDHVFSGVYLLKGTIVFEKGTFLLDTATQFYFDWKGTTEVDYFRNLGLWWPKGTLMRTSFLLLDSAKLQMIGATIDAKCPDGLWAGIIVGNGSEIHTNGYQPLTRRTVPSVIKNAEIAVRGIDMWYVDPINWTISPNNYPRSTHRFYFENTHFIDNKYESIKSEYKFNTLIGEKINDCEFTSTKRLNSGQLPRHGIYIWASQFWQSVDGLEIKNNIFSNLLYGIIANTRGILTIQGNRFRKIMKSAIEINSYVTLPSGWPSELRLIGNSIVLPSDVISSSQLNPNDPVYGIVSGSRIVITANTINNDIPNNPLSTSKYKIGIMTTANALHPIKENKISGLNEAIRLRNQNTITSNTFSNNLSAVNVPLASFNALSASIRCNTFQKQGNIIPASTPTYGIKVEEDAFLNTLGSSTLPNGNKFSGLNFPAYNDGSNFNFEYYRYNSTDENLFGQIFGFPGGNIPPATITANLNTCPGNVGVSQRLTNNGRGQQLRAFKDSLIANQGNINSRKHWQFEVINYHLETSPDSLEYFADSLALISEDSYYTLLLALEEYYLDNNTPQANSIKQKIQQSAMPNTEAFERAEFATLWHQYGNNFNLPSAPDSAKLYYYANSNLSIAELACYTLRKHYVHTPCNTYNAAKHQQTNGIENLETDNGIYLEAKPNPTDGIVEIKYKNTLSIPCENCYVIIKSIDGKEVAKVSMNNNLDNVTLNLANFTNGIYFYSLVIDGKPIKTKKLVLIK
jgi:hypothetical protein